MQLLPIPDLILLLALLVATLLFALFFAVRARTGRVPSVRPLPGIDRLRTKFSEVAESGQPIHVATGAGQLGAPGTTAETIASLMIAQRIAEETTQRGGNVAATTGEIVGHTALRGAFRRAYRQAGFISDYQPSSVQFAAQNEPTAYAAGVAARYKAEPAAASMVAGNYGAEALLITGEGAAQKIPQIAATTSLAALPVLALSADATLVGEDLFAAEAYLSDQAAPKARLRAHDALRWLIVLALIGGIVWQILAMFLPGQVPPLA